MKIKLIAPAKKAEWGESFWDLETFSRLTRKKAAGALLALPTLAALTPAGTEVVITDESVEPIDFSERVDLVGISFLTALAPRAYGIADIYRSKDVKVVLGGIHVSMLPEEAIEHADSVVIGEAEAVWPKVVSDFQAGSLKEYYYSECFPVLDSSPIPRWDLLDVDNYCYFTIQVGRGCPYSCDFCLVHVFNGRKYRHKSIDKVVEEIYFLKSIDRRKLLFFADDNLLAKPDFAAELMKALEPLNIRFWAQASVNRLEDSEMLELLFKAGCRAVFVGFESVSEDSLDLVSKGAINKTDRYKIVIDKVHSAGIGVIGSFILGIDTDDEQIFVDTLSFIEENKIAFSMINVLTPFPGTMLYGTLLQEKRIANLDWSHYNAEHVCFEPKKMSCVQLLNGRNRLLSNLNSYKSLHKRLSCLWSKGAFVRHEEKTTRFTRGRFLFTLRSLFRPNPRETLFILKSLWNQYMTSVSAVTLALNFHHYASKLMAKKKKFTADEHLGSIHSKDIEVQ